MNRVPPSLSYLTIYNPTLRVQTNQDNDDEDAEEQAHILFYTGKERAVSRDRMLRQVGLAKALISFSGLFNEDEPCSSVHSQSKRLVMVSPEPGFWIHAGIDLAKVPRVPDPRAKGKSGGKVADKGKGKSEAPVYDYDDGTMFDHVLREHILQGYQRFKLTHGSFSRILENLGQQALELQLERFWTPWAWSWDLENAPSFEQYFGPALNPHFMQLIPLVNDFDDRISQSFITVVLTKNHIIPSTRYTEQQYPATLASHLSSLIPPPVDPSPSSDTLNTLASSVDTIRAISSMKPSSNNPHAHVNAGTQNSSNTFLGMPAMTMDIKWGWPEYLKFGKVNTMKSPKNASKQSGEGEKAEAAPVGQKDDEDTSSRLNVPVNQDDLEDAMSSDSMSVSSSKRNGSSSSATNAEEDTTEPDGTLDHDEQDTESIDQPPPLPPSPSPPPLPEFSITHLHLAPVETETDTRPVSVHYYTAGEMILALISAFDSDAVHHDEAKDLLVAAEGALDLMDELSRLIAQGDQDLLMDSLPSASKILQPQDRHLIWTGSYSYRSPNFSSKSSHLFNAKTILNLDHGIKEVFSRGQNPQHWHIAKRGLGHSNDQEDGKGPEGEVFLEVFRKETSLTDVDNILTGISRKSGLVDAGLGLNGIQET
ncbi:hypothetical protein CVT24_007865 [Panaeolus cyanescens]|uniref:CCZ1/INTU/HSP4 first Longin domain-containing protein n=1 Tax=Panaeolus cyanescens TaxID=181874 RepID=A0A409VDB4_9AGAR|nr:hypothetical protein CVT24_007865 [Panaeolus cyanescens]